MSPLAQRVRLARATASGGASACLGIAAHTAAGGAPPSPLVLLTTTTLLVRLAHGLAGRRRPLPAVLGWLALSQLALHVTFALSSHPVGGRHRHTLAPVELLVERDGHGLAAVAPMTAAHLLAVLIIGLLLHRAESVIWAADALREILPAAAARLAGQLAAAAMWLRRRMAALCTVATTPSRADVARLAGVPPIRPQELPLGRAARRRGPPTVRHRPLPAV
jgi:hypothetical protein